MRIRLSDEDRGRLGAPEWVTYDASRLTNREAIQLQKAGYDPPIKAVSDAWLAQFEKVDDEHVRQARIDYEVQTAIIWVALRRAGVHVAYEELEFDANRAQWKFDEKPTEVDEGKDPSPPGTSSG